MDQVRNKYGLPKEIGIAILVLAILAIVVGFVNHIPNTPVETKTGPPTDVNPNTNPATDTANAVTAGAIVIPADALVINAGDSSVHYPINAYPQNIYLKNADILYKDIRITSTEITGTAVDVKTGRIPGTADWAIMFVKEGKYIGGISVGSPYPFKVDRKPETLGADEVWFNFGGG